MEKIKNLSLRKSIVLYMAVNLIISFFAGSFLIYQAEHLQRRIWAKYTEDHYHIERPSGMVMTEMDNRISEICDFVDTYSYLFVPMIGTVLAVFLFYRNKIKRPLNELTEASQKIAQNDLDFSVDYKNRDELGRLCAEFETMRKELVHNNKTMWRMVEEEQALRAAIAHDIRSPLTILMGYQEMLSEMFLQEAEAAEILEEEEQQLKRMERFVDRMARLSSIRERELSYEETDLAQLSEQIRKNVYMMVQDLGKNLQFHASAFSGKKYLDHDLVFEVVENLAANALRYAKETVWIELSATSDELSIAVMDDGHGFSEDAEQLTKRYYHSNPQDDLKHFGLGMYLCKVYCEKHKGRLLIANREDGGAVVTAVFGIMKNGQPG